MDFHGNKEVPTGTCNAVLKAAGLKGEISAMLKLKYTLVIEATEDPSFFGFYSSDLEGFSGVGHSIEDCIPKGLSVYKATWGMEEHLALLREQMLSVPPPSPHPSIIIQNEQVAVQVA